MRFILRPQRRGSRLSSLYIPYTYMLSRERANRCSFRGFFPPRRSRRARYGRRRNISVVRGGNVVIQQGKNSVSVRGAGRWFSIYAKGDIETPPPPPPPQAHLSAFCSRWRWCSLSRAIKRSRTDKFYPNTGRVSLSLSFSRLAELPRLLRAGHVRARIALGTQRSLAGHEISVTPSR